MICVCLIVRSKRGLTKRGISKRSWEAGIVLLICVLVLLPSCGGGSGGAGGGGGGTPPNPTPSITSLSPSQIAAGSNPLPTPVVKGPGFFPTTAPTHGGN